MRWLGKYAVVEGGRGQRRHRVVFYLIFEIWFKVPLPKGPLENLLGLD